MKMQIKALTVLCLIFLTVTFTSNALTPEFTDELSRVGVRVEPDDSNAMEVLSETGINTIRYALNWHKFEPTKGEFDTDYIDERISILKNSDINSIVGIGVNNNLYSGKNDIRYGVESKENLDAFTNYCKALASYLSENYPEIKTFLIWNEPNSASFWKDEPNPVSYFNLVKEASLAFKSVIPDCTIAAGVTANPSILFLNQLFELGIYKYADVITSQPYVTPSNADSDTLEYRLNSYNKLINKYGGFKDIYLSEIGWNTSGTVTEEIQASNIIKTLVMADNYDISGVNLYELVDGTGNAVESENHFGLLNSNYSPKKGLSALICYQDVIGGANFAGKITSDDGNTFAYIYHKNGKILAILWTKNKNDSLSSLSINTYDKVFDLYGNNLTNVTISNEPIYLETNDSAILYRAISTSLSNYYKGIDGIVVPDLSSMSAMDIKNKIEENYNLASDIFANDTSTMETAYKLHLASVKLGTLYTYLAQDIAVPEISSDQNIWNFKNSIENSETTVNFKINLKDLTIGDTVTLMVNTENGNPVLFTQKTFGSGIEPIMDFSLKIKGRQKLIGKIASYPSSVMIESIESDSDKITISSEITEFSISYNDKLDADFIDFKLSYPYANSIMKQAEKFNIQANTLKASPLNSVTKGASVEITDLIATKLADLATAIRHTETPNFDNGFSIIATPRVIKSSGIHNISTQISNKNDVAFSGYLKVYDNYGNELISNEVSIPAFSEGTSDFELEIPNDFNFGQYFYNISLMIEDTVLSTSSVFISNQVGPYNTYELSNSKIVSSTPFENKFSVNGKEYILLDTTNNDTSKFFIMEENISEAKYFDPDKYDIRFDVTDPDNIGFYLNQDYAIDESVKAYIDYEHKWLTEAGYGDSVCPTDYTDTYGVSLLSVEEWNKFADKYGYSPNGINVNTWWMRTPGTNIDTIRYVSKVTGNSLHTTPNGEKRGIRPVYYLSRDFFKTVKVENMGANVLNAIKSSYSPQELLIGGAYTYKELEDMGIINENKITFTHISFKNSNGEEISAPENQQEINLSLLYEGNQEFSAILAIYDSNGCLISCQSEEGTKLTNINIKLSKPAEIGSYAKCFIWDSNTLKPLNIPLIFPSIINN